jgi:membrane protein required for colicin V production
MEATEYNYIDYIVIGITLVSMLFALIRGFISSFLSLTGWVLSIYLTYVAYPFAAPFLGKLIKNDMVLLVCGHSIVLVCFLIAFGIFNLMVSTALKGLSRGMFDRLLGLGFGFIRGALLVSFCYYIAATLVAVMNGTTGTNPADDKGKPVEDQTIPAFILQAKTYPYLKMGKEAIEDFIPAAFHDQVQEAYGQMIKKTTDEVFLDSIAKRMEGQLNPEQKKQLQELLDESALTKSDKELEELKAQELMKMHKQNKTETGTGSGSKKSPISDQEINKLEKVLKSPPQEEDLLHFDEPEGK